MASASTSGQATFGLGRRKKNPGLLDQIGKFFGGDRKRKSKARTVCGLSLVFQLPQCQAVRHLSGVGGQNGGGGGWEG
ncbi:hypothetical protein JZ751_015645 [Albula glossodonta]|uniref:Myelin basic protein n=1 Tax=Albula glossodonta TaxID=121402 RepID=A0A8T2NRC7_9TELE|nr:hypothetical protein JZ751_015645 [Albula glossodonta]